MSNQKKLAVKVMEYANEFTGWNFGIEQRDNTYLVGATLSNEKGQEIAVYYLIGKGKAELQVISMNNKYDYEFIKKKINKVTRGYPVCAMGMEQNSIIISSPMPLEVLDRDMTVIIRKRMTDMIQLMTDALNYCS